MAKLQPKEAPALSIPESSSIVQVQAVDTTLRLYVKSENFLSPVLPGHEVYNCPTMAFLLTHPVTGNKVLFDAGARKDYWNYSPFLTGRFEESVNVKGMRVDKNVDEVLRDAGVEMGDLTSIIWSHWHFDHTGDVSKFDPSVELVVGPGFKANLLPGYPTNPNSPLLETDYSGRELREITFDGKSKIGNFNAFDFFGDGSFYLLDVPGHAIGHLCGLARTKATTFMLLGADSCHFAGSLRPSPYIPLPETLDTTIHGLDPHFPSPCPCSIFGTCHPAPIEEEKRTTSYYTVSKAPGSAYIDPEVANQSVSSLKVFDASPDVFLCLAHDPALFEILPLLNSSPPNSNVNDWQTKGYKDRTRWMFLNELPRDGKPGRPPMVLGFWRDGKEVDIATALRRRT